MIAVVLFLRFWSCNILLTLFKISNNQEKVNRVQIKALSGAGPADQCAHLRTVTNTNTCLNLHHV